MTITIRLARLEDAPGIAKVHVDSWRTTYKGLIADEFLAALSYERRTQVWTQSLADPQIASFLYVAETKTGEIVGFVSAGPEHEGDPNYRLLRRSTHHHGSDRVHLFHCFFPGPPAGYKPHTDTLTIKNA
jgi:L-amino acid N-acyltransferase YncA